MVLLTLQTMHDEILDLYQEVYWLKRDPGEVQCLENIAEETQIEILETLKECLWHRWGPTQPEREARCDRQSFMPRCRQPMSTLVAIVEDSKSPKKRPYR